MRLYIPEILAQVALAPTKEEKVNVLKKYDNTTLRSVLKLNFDKDTMLDLPPGHPTYKIDKDMPLGLGDSNLYNESRRFYLLVKGNGRRPAALKPIQIENIWIQILEGVHWTEAELLCQMKDRQLSKVYKGLTEAIVREAFPDLIPEKPSKS